MECKRLWLWLALSRAPSQDSLQSQAGALGSLRLVSAESEGLRQTGSPSSEAPSQGGRFAKMSGSSASSTI